MADFFKSVETFNKMYRIPCPATPGLHGGMTQRIQQFQSMVQHELTEGGEIAEKVQDGAPQIEILTDLADWLGDIVVYATSEAVRYGIPLPEVLAIIMESNASKLQADGTAKFVDGKLQKGPNYWKPEPRIRALLEEKLN
jgi:predicted HAD superfamily Cof-like phosphohydrolase